MLQRHGNRLSKCRSIATKVAALMPRERVRISEASVESVQSKVSESGVPKRVTMSAELSTELTSKIKRLHCTVLLFFVRAA